MMTQDPSPQQRRGFLIQFFALVGGAIVLLPPILTGAFSFLSPLKKKEQAGGWFKLALLAALPDGGTPKKFPVIASREDAWNRFPDEPIGAVYLLRRGEDKVTAFQAACPHLSCAISYQIEGEVGCFACPCHGAKFDLDGKRFPGPSESPRDMDTLQVEIRNGEVWVKFERFATGLAERKAVG